MFVLQHWFVVRDRYSIWTALHIVLLIILVKSTMEGITHNDSP